MLETPAKRECYSLRRFKGQSEQSLGVSRCRCTQIDRIFVTSARQPSNGVEHPSRFVSLPAKWHWREIRGIRLDQQSVSGHESQQRVVSPFLESDDTAERHVPPCVDREFSERRRSSVAVEDADHVGGARFTDDCPRVVFCVACVYDDRPAHFMRQLHLCRKGGSLRVARRIVVVVVESAFADSDCRVSQQRAQLRKIACSIELRSVMGMDARSSEHESRIIRGQLARQLRRR